jgi:hypothetical protein
VNKKNIKGATMFLPSDLVVFFFLTLPLATFATNYGKK